MAVVEFRSNNERNWANFWAAVTAPIREGWAGVPDLEDAITRAEPMVRARWNELFDVMAPTIWITLPDGLTQAQVEAMRRTCYDIGQQYAAQFNSRIHVAATWIAFETLRAESGWRN